LFLVGAKQFVKRTAYDSHLTGKKHLRAAEGLIKQGIEAVTTEVRAQARRERLAADRQRDRPLAFSEFLVKAYMVVLTQIRDDTCGFVERKQTLTERERVAETLEEVELEEAEEEDEEEKIYNPLKLPLGWDGKPIPYWLYKLHGLGVEYPCEICGNFVYMGRKAFERHFQVRSFRSLLEDVGEGPQFPTCLHGVGTSPCSRNAESGYSEHAAISRNYID
jgi:splicing factor 3A subunit 3